MKDNIATPVSVIPAKRKLLRRSINGIDGVAITLESTPPTSVNKHSPGSEAESINTGSARKTINGKAPQFREVPTDAAIPMAPLDDEPAPFVPNPNFKANSSIPKLQSWHDYGFECVKAAYDSRLSPYSLHPKEYELLRNHLTYVQVTHYLNIRNGILRVWLANPTTPVSMEEAAGCAKHYRFFNLAEVAYDWLCRHGYINFGCLEPPKPIPIKHAHKRKRTIVVIGGGVSGLGAARQLELLLAQYQDEFESLEEIPNVIVVEARCRLGGRVYSHPLKGQDSTLENGKMSRIDLGGQIITGFEGNPIATIFNDQLKIPSHKLNAKMNLHDLDGSIVDVRKDERAQKFYNDVLDRVSIYKQKSDPLKTVEGDRAKVDTSTDPKTETGVTIAKVEENEVSDLPPLPPTPISRINGAGSPFSASVDNTTGKPMTATGSSAKIPAAKQIKKLGYMLKPGVDIRADVPIERVTNNNGYNALGTSMDKMIEHYRDLIEITSLDLRLYNWHQANLEYANGSRIDKLSLENWDQDDGNEFGGPHAMIIGGYCQVPMGIALVPGPLNLKVRSPITKISYAMKEEDKAVTLTCADGSVIEADKVICTVPLGVLKSETIEFDPPLPVEKTDAIKRLGFGLLNKVVLVYKKPFWNTDHDMIGSLRDPRGDGNVQANYLDDRGRFYMFWNCIAITGRPVLVALMAGEAAEQTERENDHSLIQEATAVLRKIFSEKAVPIPDETLITRWRSDQYARGTYSYLAPGATGQDYDRLAAPVGENLFFAGEASCRTHPATVHGAYISGLRVAAEVMESLIGPIEVKTPLIHAKPKVTKESKYETIAQMKKRKAQTHSAEQERPIAYQRTETDDDILQSALIEKLGTRPDKLAKPPKNNAWLLYQNDYWKVAKEKCNEALRVSTGKADAIADRDTVRVELGIMWRATSPETRKPYDDQVEVTKQANEAAAAKNQAKMDEWDIAAEVFRKEWFNASAGSSIGSESNGTDRANVDTDGQTVAEQFDTAMSMVDGINGAGSDMEAQGDADDMEVDQEDKDWS